MPLENQGKPVDCPDIKDKGVNDRVVNYGTYIAGTGILHVNSDAPTNPLFQANIVPGSDVPLDLESAGYRNCGVEYNPANGGVVCKYRSHCGHDPFTLGYILKNGLDGVVNSSSSEEIHINLPAGLK